MLGAEGPYKVLEKYGENAYKLKHPCDYGVSPTFQMTLRMQGRWI